MRTLLVTEGKVLRHDFPEAKLSAALASPDAFIWLDIENPTEEDAALLVNEFGFHQLAVEDAVRSRERPKVDIYQARAAVAVEDSDLPVPPVPDSAHAALIPGAYYFVVFYGLTVDVATRALTTEPLSMFVGTHYLVTVHPRPIREIAETAARLQAPKSPVERRSGAVVYTLLDALVDDYFPLIDVASDQAEELEDAIFESANQDTIEQIFNLKKQLLRMRQIVAPERDVVNVLLRRELPVFKSRDVAYLQDVYDHLVRLTDGLDTYRDLVSSALDSYLSIQSNRLNEIMKTLTIGSILLMASALIAGIYGMNFMFIPELGQKWGYPWALLLMALVSGGLAFYFKRRDWF